MTQDIYHNRDVLLARIDERVGAIHDDIQSLKNEVGGIKQDYVTKNECKARDAISVTVRRDIDILHATKVSRTEFEPIKKLAYGIVGVILIAVSGAIIKLVL